jgi:8-oxo-dGTP pyrophosphatase MutT (NUDIX family)
MTRWSNVSDSRFPASLNSVVIQRTVYEGTHSGQIAFPGGKWETTDHSMKETALRECWEEIGVTADELDYVGKLTDVFTSVSSFLIEPHVFYWKAPRTNFTLSEREVAAVYAIDLCQLQDDANIVQIDVPIRNGIVLKAVPHFVLNDIRIWGATAIMLSELREVLRTV